MGPTQRAHSPIQPERCYDWRPIWYLLAHNQLLFRFRPGDLLHPCESFYEEIGSRELLNHPSWPRPQDHGELGWCPSWQRPRLHEGQAACCGCDGRGHVLTTDRYHGREKGYDPRNGATWTYQTIVIELDCRYCEATGDMAVTNIYIRRQQERDALFQRARDAATQAAADAQQGGGRAQQSAVPPLQPAVCYYRRQQWKRAAANRSNFPYAPGAIVERPSVFWKAATGSRFPGPDELWSPAWQRPQLHESDDACYGCEGTGAVLGLSKIRRRELEVVEQCCRYCVGSGEGAIMEEYRRYGPMPPSKPAPRPYEPRRPPNPPGYGGPIGPGAFG